MDKDTPITKYLATLERRQAQRDLLFGSPSPGVSPELRNRLNIRQQLRFDDETFLNPDQTLNFSPHFRSRPILPSANPLSTNSASNGANISTALVAPSTTRTNETESFLSSSGRKRKRYSFELPDDEDTIKKLAEVQTLLRSTNGELVESRALAAKLERQKQEMRDEFYEKTIKFEKAMAEMKIKSRNAGEKAEELECDNEKLKKKLDELREELRRHSIMNAEKHLNLETKVAELLNENVQLKQKYEEELQSQSAESKKIAVEIREKESSFEKTSSECDMLREQLRLKDSQLENYKEELKEVQKVALKYNEMKQKLEDSDTDEAKMARLSESLNKYENLYIQQQNENNQLAQLVSKLTEENNIFKASMNREMLLEEQISSLEDEARRLKLELDTKNDLELEKASLERNLVEWKDIAKNVNQEYTSPKDFEAFVGKLQADLFEMKHENTTLTRKLECMEDTHNKLKSDALDSAKALSDANNDIESMKNEMKQLSRRIVLLTNDRDGLKELKESYEKELEGMISAALKTRVDELEKTVYEYEAIVSETPGLKKCQECDSRMALISDLRRELEKFKTEQPLGNVTLNETLAEDPNVSTVKVFTYGQNPSTISLETRIKDLCDENAKLAEKLKQLEDCSQLGPSTTELNAEKTMMQEQLRALERKHEILTEAYNYETQQLQVALSKLFGFHVILQKENQSQFRLQSVYASPDEEIIFQESENGSDMMLLETRVLDNFRTEIDRYLLSEGSIPAFLASVTIMFSQGLSSQASEGDVSRDDGGSQESRDDDTVISSKYRKVVHVEIDQRMREERDDESVDEEDDIDMEEEENPDEIEDEEDCDEEEEEELDENENQSQDDDEEIVCLSD